MLGSVAERIVRTAPVPVLTVSTAAAQACEGGAAQRRRAVAAPPAPGITPITTAADLPLFLFPRNPFARNRASCKMRASRSLLRDRATPRLWHIRCQYLEVVRGVVPEGGAMQINREREPSWP